LTTFDYRRYNCVIEIFEIKKKAFDCRKLQTKKLEERMAKEKKNRVLAYPPKDFHWIEDFEDLEKLAEIYSKLMAITDYFSTFNNPSVERPVMANNVYGFWFIFRDICDDLEDILKVDHWTGKIGKKADEGEES
jgi:hypothetical protein